MVCITLTILINDTVEELLMNGTEEAIDEHCYFKTGKYPIEGDEVEISLFS